MVFRKSDQTLGEEVRILKGELQLLVCGEKKISSHLIVYYFPQTGGNTASSNTTNFGQGTLEIPISFQQQTVRDCSVPFNNQVKEKRHSLKS